MIKLQKLDKYFNKGKQNEIHVINDISLELPESGIVAIFGKSGCGKTTLLNVIGGLDSYGSGSVTLDGESISKNTDTLRNKYIGYIFQNYNLNKGESCFDNVADALRLCGIKDAEVIKTRVNAALRCVGLEHYGARTPDTLSGGQQQRIAIARAIVKNPRIILADEPTGNLDDANTVMIMDLLKEISRDHLVLLVTHEANLVDYYCDTVVELSDGKVINIRRNEGAEGYSARGKNDIYLGELEKNELSADGVALEYYGEPTDEPIKLKVVNSGGKLYIRVDSDGVQVLDRQSEVKLREGVYEERKKTVDKSVNMSELPPIEGEKFGKLFTLCSALKSGYTANFKRGKKGKKILRGCLCLFAATIVIMSAVFGTSLSDLLDVQRSYNHNTFYVYTPDGETSQKLSSAVGNADTGIDYARLYYGVPYGDENYKFMTGFFDTFSTTAWDDSFRTNAVTLDISVLGEPSVLAGRIDDLGEDSVAISRRVADELLDKSSLGYIDGYDDLIGLMSLKQINGKNVRIKAVVESNESAVYLNSTALAKSVMLQSGLAVKIDGDFGMDVERGHTVYAQKNTYDKANTVNVGDKVQIHGKSFTVDKVMKYTSDYAEWLRNNGIRKTDVYEFLKYGDVTTDARYFEYYDYFYSEFDRYLEERTMFTANEDINIWLYSVKGIEDIKYTFMYGKDTEGIYYYRAVKYKEQHGVYPTLAQVEEMNKGINDDFEFLRSYENQYREEFYSTNYKMTNTVQNAFFVDSEDYIELSLRTGETDDVAKNYLGEYTNDNFYIGGAVEIVPVSYSAVGADIADVDISYAGGSSFTYTLLHSSDPEKTAQYLAREFPDHPSPGIYEPAVLTPNDIFDSAVEEYASEIVASLIAMAVILVLMSVCMYFIMRFSLMNRIKEVGIYRAIGVSKKNLVYKFLIEAVVLTTLTVFIGYLATSAFLGACLSASSFMESVLYYPAWLAGILLVIIYAICLFFGTMPTVSLLRKTPSEILSKYDI